MRSVKQIVLVAGVFLIAGCDSASNQMDMSQTDVLVNASGEQLFNQFCAPCHKKSGVGNLFKGIPSNRRTKLTEEEINVLLHTGQLADKGMPDFSFLQAEQIESIVDHLQVLKTKAEQEVNEKKARFQTD